MNKHITPPHLNQGLEKDGLRPGSVEEFYNIGMFHATPTAPRRIYLRDKAASGGPHSADRAFGTFRGRWQWVPLGQKITKKTNKWFYAKIILKELRRDTKIIQY